MSEHKMPVEFTGNNRDFNDPDKLAIARVPAGLRISLSTHTATSGFFDPADAPAIALAILEASGVEPRIHGEGPLGSEQVNVAAEHLKRFVQGERAMKRRDELAREFAAGGGYYQSCKESLQKAIDRIIELERA
jgi:hypothetical protein